MYLGTHSKIECLGRFVAPFLNKRPLPKAGKGLIQRIDRNGYLYLIIRGYESYEITRPTFRASECQYRSIPRDYNLLLKFRDL